MPSTLVRKAVEADLPRLVELLQQMSLDEPREQPGEPLLQAYWDAFARIDNEPGHHLLVVEAGGRIAGTAVLWIIPNLSYRARPKAIVENVVIDSELRGGGYGGMLIDRCIELAREAGCVDIALMSNKRRTDAHRFYSNHGFAQSHEGFRLYL